MGERISYDQIVSEESKSGTIKLLAVFLVPTLLVPLAHFIYDWPAFGKLSENDITTFLLVGLTMFGGFFFAAILPAKSIFLLVKSVRKAKARTSSVKGEILKSELDAVFSGTMNVYTPVITYAYAVGKKTYTDTYWPYPNKRHNIMPLHKRTLKKFVPGNEIMVYYNPQKPGESSLKPDHIGHFFIRFSFLLVLNILSSFILGASLTLLIRGFMLGSVLAKIIVAAVFLPVMIGLFFFARYYCQTDQS